MHLIADCGATKIEWIVADGDTVVDRVVTEGINFSQTGVKPLSEILDTLDVGTVDAVYFYGAGCLGGIIDEVRNMLSARFAGADVEVASDMLAAARALCGREAGIACILGTGANSCLYDGNTIVDNVPALGYILGDEGSGAVLGRNMLNMVFKRRLSPEVTAAFEDRYGLTAGDVIARTYRGERPAAFLASFAPFINEYIGDSDVERMVVESFEAFFRNNVCAYDGHDRLLVNFTGSIAANFSRQLADAARRAGCTIGLVTPSPSAGLVAYHSAK